MLTAGALSTSAGSGADVVARLYAGFAAHDPAAIAATLHADFRGIVSAGMPLGVGGVHEGPEAMLRDCWGVVFTSYAVTPTPYELVGLSDGRVLALGDYLGTKRTSGREVRAAFAHVLELRDGLVVELRQITDTASW